MNEHLPTIVEYAQHSPIPRKVLLFLQREGIVQDPLNREDQIGLRLLEKVWGNKTVLRSQLSRMSLKVRESFVRTVSLNSKWERYAYSRFFNQEPGSRLSVQKVIDEIQTTFRFKPTKNQVNRIQKIRNQAQVARHRVRDRNQQEDSDQAELLQNAN